MRASDEAIHHLKDKVGLKEADRIVAAVRAEALHEGADALEARVADDDVDTRSTWAGMGAAYLRRLAEQPTP